ncbi:MAG: hypothetical protein RL186_1848, partial [Pseudomonadota bacterium]
MALTASSFGDIKRKAIPEMARAAGFDCPSVFAPADWSLDAVHAFAQMLGLSEGASVTEAVVAIVEALSERASATGLLADDAARAGFEDQCFVQLMARTIALSKPALTLLGFAATIEPAAALVDISSAQAHEVIAARKQAQFDAAALTSGREALRHSLAQVSEAVGRAFGQGHADPRDNPVLATAIAKAFANGAPAGAVAEAIDDARHGHEAEGRHGAAHCDRHVHRWDDAGPHHAGGVVVEFRRGLREQRLWLERSRIHSGGRHGHG